MTFRWGYGRSPCGPVDHNSRVIRAEPDTRHGYEVAARWFGLQAFLREDAALPTIRLPRSRSGSDTSRGAALGVAPAAVAALPMRVESTQEAWSKQSGQWRLLETT